MADNRVADIIEMRHLAVVKHENVLEFAGVAHHAVVSDDDVLAHVGTVANLAVFPDDGRAFDHGAVLHHRALADKNLVANPRRARAFIEQTRAQVAAQIVLQLAERLPGVFAAVEQRSVRCLRKLEQIGRLEHGLQFRKKPRTRKAKWPTRKIPCARLETRKLSLHRTAFLPLNERLNYGSDTHSLRNLERRTLHALWRAAQ